VNLTLIQNNFISGEVSPLLEGRIDSPRYQTGLKLCQNFLPTRQGGFRKRPGTISAGTTKSNAKARLIELTIADDYYIIELTNLKARIWKSDYTIVGGGTPTEITTPWPTADLASLKYAIEDGTVWIAHHSYAVRTLALVGSTWTLSTPTFTGDRTFASAGKYPRVIFFVGGRLGLAGTDDEPTAVFLSKTPLASTGATRYTDFDFDTGDDGTIAPDDAIYLLESDITPILWAIGSQRVFMGTNRTVWMDSGQGITPADFDMSVLSYNGASEPQAVMSETITLYVGRGGKSLHALVYDSDRQSYQDIDLSRDFEHFLSSPIVDMKIQNFPEPVLWMVRADGLLVSCALDLQAGMVAWARHPMSGTVESISVGYGATEDVLWMTVLRGTTRTVEYLRFQDPTTTVQTDFHYVDSGLVFTYGSPTDTVTGLGHLEGMEVVAWADGAILPPQTVASGQVSYASTFSKIHIGLVIESEAQTLRPSGQVSYASTFSKIHIGLVIESEAQTLRPETPANGTSQGKNKRIENATARLYRSLGGEIGALSGNTVKLLTWKSGTYIWGSAPELYTGDLEANIAAALDKDARLDIVHTDPAPFFLLAIIYRVAVMEV